MADKASIRSKRFISQVVNFSSFQIGQTKIVPTDIDGLIEYHSRCFVYIEAKYNGCEMPIAQRKALEEVCDDHRRPTMLMLVSHGDTDEIDLGNASVVEYRYGRKWRVPKKPYTANELSNAFIEWVDAEWMTI